MADYPVLDGSGAAVVASQYDPALARGRQYDYTQDYPVRDGNGLSVVEARTALGPDVLANGDFKDGADGWARSGEDGTHVLTFEDNALRYQSDTTSPQLLVSQPGVLEVGEDYEITVSVRSYVSGSLKSDQLGGLVASGEGAVTYTRTATATSFAITRNSANVDMTLESISIRKVL